MLTLALALLTGCAMRTYVVEMSEPTDNAHYVIVESGPGSQKVYDCLSRPDGKTWQPTCVKADMRNVAPPSPGAEPASEAAKKK